MQKSRVRISIRDQYGNVRFGTAEVTSLSGRDAFWNGGRRAAKWIGSILLVALPFGFLEPFLFMIWGSLLLLFLFVVVGPFLHLKFSDERQSFTFVSVPCPYCESNQPLTPYLSSRFDRQFTALCPSCGQTVQVLDESSRE